jgi:hypothetical protein
MDVAEVHELVDALAGDVSGADRSAAEAAAVAVRRLIGWAHGRQMAVARRLDDVTSFPQASLATAARNGLADADRVVERSRVAEAMPSFETALLDGAVTVEHVDIVVGALRKLDSADGQSQLIGQAARLARIAEHANTDDFRRTVSQEVLRIRRAAGETGEARLARQRAAARLSTWVGHSDGMWNIRGTFDPVTGFVLDGQLQAVMDSMFATTTPPDAPTDGRERQAFLRARAFVELIQHGPDAGLAVQVDAVDSAAGPGGRVDTAGRDGRRARGSRWRSDSLIVLHTSDPALCSAEPARIATALADGDITVDDPRLADVPAAAVADLVARSRRTVSVVNNPVAGAAGAGEIGAGAVGAGASDAVRVSIDGATASLSFGRSRRVASREQRLALRALYPTCALPGCAVPFRLCSIHHVRWWRSGGLTDLANLIPVCERHHRRIHDEGWQVGVDPQRQLTVRQPDGSSSIAALPQPPRVPQRAGSPP